MSIKSQKFKDRGINVTGLATWEKKCNNFHDWQKFQKKTVVGLRGNLEFLVWRILNLSSICLVDRQIFIPMLKLIPLHFIDGALKDIFQMKTGIHDYIRAFASVVQLVKTSSLMRVVMSSSPDWIEHFLIFHNDSC